VKTLTFLQAVLKTADIWAGGSIVLLASFLLFMLSCRRVLAVSRAVYRLLLRFCRFFYLPTGHSPQCHNLSPGTVYSVAEQRAVWVGFWRAAGVFVRAGGSAISRCLYGILAAPSAHYGVAAVRLFERRTTRHLPFPVHALTQRFLRAGDPAHPRACCSVLLTTVLSSTPEPSPSSYSVSGPSSSVLVSFSVGFCLACAGCWLTLFMGIHLGRRAGACMRLQAMLAATAVLHLWLYQLTAYTGRAFTLPFLLLFVPA